MATWRLLSSINRSNLSCTRRLGTNQNSIISKLKRSVEKDILPPKPKKPLNPFLRYCQSVKSELQKEYPDLKNQDIIKKISERWAQLDLTAKEPLQKQYVKEFSVYKQKLSDYESSITKDQRMLVQKELIKKEDAWQKNQVKQKLAELGKPKRPMAAFFLFLQSKKVGKDLEISQYDWLSRLSNEWKNMPTEAKSKYVTEATQLLEKYKIDMKKWQEDMIRAGHECPSQYTMQTTESISAEFFNIENRNKEPKQKIKTGWGTDITYCTSNNTYDAKNDQHITAKSLILYKDKPQDVIKYPRDVIEDASINNVKQTQSYNIYTEMRESLMSVWRRFLIVSKEIIKNWKTKYANPSGLS